MSIVQVSDLIKIFFKYPLSYIPLMDENPGGDIYLVGFLSKQKVLHYSSDKERLESRFERIPDFFISKEISPEHIWEFFEKSPIPVYSIFAQFIETWDKQEINYHLKNFLYTVKNTDKEKNEAIQDNLESEKNEKYYLLELILSTIPFPLFAININGNSIFYNEFFLKEILDKGPFKKTLALAESYFKELVKDIIADHILKNKNTDYMIWDWKKLNYKIIISNLIEDNEVIGYLLTFIALNLQSEKVQEKTPDLVVKDDNQLLTQHIEKQLSKGKNYDEIIEDIESIIILNYLNKNNHNITHTAEELRIKRTTLQNKIKRYNIILNELDKIEKEKNIDIVTKQEKTKKQKKSTSKTTTKKSKKARKSAK
ncbi:MAG: hypothetical protein KatS3mg129_0491 [Leptospiraceae bacterium]|nr:MAG: hypothetical protein KatS3mg129_0491 [Leptospiraceae bacterium]